jgi:hypothetical protein
MGSFSWLTGTGRSPPRDPPDITSPEFKANPYPFSARLRAQAPVYQVTLPTMGGTAWLITRYDDEAMLRFLASQILLAIIGGLIGKAIGSTKGTPGAGFFLGFFLGPIGWLIMAVLPDTRPTCPFCKGTIVRGAAQCKNCGSVIPRCPACNKMVRGDPVACKHCGQPLKEQGPRDLGISPQRADYRGHPLNEQREEDNGDFSPAEPAVVRDALQADICFPCPSCGQSIKTKPRMTGRQARCPGCGSSFVVPNK